jgi:hypothetical protein
MPPVEAKVRISSNILREPQVLDNLCPQGGSIARNILVWASWKGTLKVELNLSDFCARMGYDRKHLLRELTSDQKALMLSAGWPEEQLIRRGKDDTKSIRNGNCLIAYVLTLMYSRTLPFKHRPKSSKHLHFYNKVMIRELITCEKRKKGTFIEFVVSEEVLQQARGAYQTIEMGDYLSLTSESGKPDDAAQRMYLRLRWMRRYWDWLDREGKIEKGTNPSVDSYTDLLAVAGIGKHKQASLAAHKLKTLLTRIGKLESVKMTPTVKLDYPTGLYQVTWKRDKMSAAAQSDESTPFPAEQAKKNQRRQAAPAPLLSHAAFKGAADKPLRAAAPAPAVSREKLLNQLHDAATSLRWQQSEEAEFHYANMPDGQHEQDLAAARARLLEVQEQLGMA